MWGSSILKLKGRIFINYITMTYIKAFFNYIFSVFNPLWTDTGLHFFIKSILALIYSLILSILIPVIINIVFIRWGNYDAIWTLFFINTIITIIIFFWLQLIVAARRFRDLWRSQWSLLIYFLSMFTWIIGIIYWLYLCFAKNNNSIKNKKINI